VTGIVLLGTSLAGCASSDELKQRINGRWGPNPAIQSAEVATVVQGQTDVIRYIAVNSGMIPAGATVFVPTSANLMVITKWGFNVGRQDCEIYLDNLFRMNREKQRNDGVLTALGTAAAAIVTGTTTAQKPLSILAAAFGLGIALNDAVLQSFLFTEAPGLVAKKVKDLQDAYRDSIENNPSQIADEADAYNAIQNYYHLCLPHAIEGVLLQNVADSAPVTPPTPGATPAAPMLAAPAKLKSLNRPPVLQ
jgi:hypothetical protein